MANSPNAFASFMASMAGRGIRIFAGLALIAWGVTHRNSTPGMILLGVGFVPLLAGMLNLCLLAPLLGAPFSGRALLRDAQSDGRGNQR